MDRHETPLTWLDSQVSGVLAGRQHLPAGERVLAALAWAMDPSRRIAPRALRGSLRRVAPELGHITGSTPRWTELTRKARRYVSASRDDAARGDAAVAVARSFLSRCVLAPVVARQAAAQQARAAAAVIAVDTLRQLAPGGSGWRTVMVSQEALAIRLGVTRGTAAGALTRAADESWVSLVSIRPGRAGRYRPALQAAPGTAERLDRGDLYDAVEALSRLDDDEALVAVICAADHPAWTRLGRSAWTAALAMAAGMEPGSLGMSRTTVRASKLTAVDRLGPVDRWTGAAIRAALDQVADQPDEAGRTARQERAEAEAELAAAQAARAERRAAHAAEKRGKSAQEAQEQPEQSEEIPVREQAAEPAAARWADLPAAYDHANADHRARLQDHLLSRGLRPVSVDLMGRRVRVESTADRAA